jgi:metal-responsive CopG/Arc/MetJ family transcriptional regulator
MAKILLSLDERLVRRIDAAARRLGLTRSAYVAQLAQKELGGRRGPGAAPEVRRAIGEIRRMFSERGTASTDWTRVIREMRDARLPYRER